MKFTNTQTQRLNRLLSSIALDSRWITVKPNGPDKQGRPVRISDDGTVEAGMGGKFNGEKITEIRKSFVGAKTPKNIEKSESKEKTSKRLEKLYTSLKNKNDKFESMLKNHFETVKEANGQPLNDKRNGAATLKKWDRQADSLNRQLSDLEKTERAIEREKELINRVESTKIPSVLNDAIQSGEITQWRKYPNRFFVKGVEKGRIIWDEKKKTILVSHYQSIPEEQKPIFKKAFYELKGRIEGKTAEQVEKENDDQVKAKQKKQLAEIERKKSIHNQIRSLFKAHA